MEIWAINENSILQNVFDSLLFGFNTETNFETNIHFHAKVLR